MKQTAASPAPVSDIKEGFDARFPTARHVGRRHDSSASRHIQATHSMLAFPGAGMQTAQLAVRVTDRDHSLGPKNAPVTLVEYGDFECAHCARAHPLMHGIRRYMGEDLRLVYRHFPLTAGHPYAARAAEVAEAASAQGKFWQMLDTLFRAQHPLEDEELLLHAAGIGIDAGRLSRELIAHVFAGKVRDDLRGGIRSGVFGTPTFFINEMRYDGNWLDAAEFIQALSDAATTPAAGLRGRAI
jgi:protein-disulfide isomerase